MATKLVSVNPPPAKTEIVLLKTFYDNPTPTNAQAIAALKALIRIVFLYVVKGQ